MFLEEELPQHKVKSTMNCNMVYLFVCLFGVFVIKTTLWICMLYVYVELPHDHQTCTSNSNCGSIHCGHSHHGKVCSGGKCYCTGENERGSITGRSTPVVFKRLEDFFWYGKSGCGYGGGWWWDNFLTVWNFI